MRTLWMTSTTLGLLNPSAVAPAKGLLDERIYVADTGHDQVLLIALPVESATSAWDTMVQKLGTGDREGALSHFASAAVDKYRKAFKDVTDNDLIQIMNDIGVISPVFIQNGIAECQFQQQVFGLMLTFPIKFIRENGAWKILDF